LEGGSALFGLCAPGRDLLQAEVLRRASRLAVAGRGTPAPDEGRVTENFVARSLQSVFADAGLVGAIIFLLPLSVECVGVALLRKPYLYSDDSRHDPGCQLLPRRMESMGPFELKPAKNFVFLYIEVGLQGVSNQIYAIRAGWKWVGQVRNLWRWKEGECVCQGGAAAASQ